MIFYIIFKILLAITNTQKLIKLFIYFFINNLITIKLKFLHKLNEKMGKI